MYFDMKAMRPDSAMASLLAKGLPRAETATSRTRVRSASDSADSSKCFLMFDKIPSCTSVQA